MTKPKKSEVAAKLEEWAKNEKKRLKLEADRDLAIEPYTTKYERTIAPVIGPFDEKLAPLVQTKARLEKEITDAMERGIDLKGLVSLPQVVVDKAIVEVKTSTKREVDPEELLEEVPESQRDAGFFGCFSVLVGKLEKYRSDLLNKLASEQRSHKVLIRLLD